MYLQSKNSSDSLTLFWIPSHIGIEGNEIVDWLARQTTLDDSIDVVKTPYTDLYESLKKNCYSQTIEYLVNLGNTIGKEYFEKFFNLKKLPGL